MKLLIKIKKLFQKKPKFIVVLGQTSTGKSDLAVEIAKEIDGEIISADSRQVYRGMDLGSGKITKAEMQGIPHHLLDVADPQETFSVKDFQDHGEQAINHILSRKKTPIICGGTGFYIDSLVYKTQFPKMKKNKKLREHLQTKNIEELNKILKERVNNSKKKYKKHNKRFYRQMDQKNHVRLVRAIEIINTLGYIPKIKKEKHYNILFLGLELEKETLKKRIYKRIIDRLDKGMLNEGKKLLEIGVSHKKLQSFGLEYRFMSKHILGKINYDEMIEQLYRATVQFAKRQKTWFKRNKNIHWYNPIKDNKVIFNEVNKFIKK